MFLTTIPAIFSNVYHENVGIAGLHYIALGLGLSCASQINARLMDPIYIHFKNKNGGSGRPEYRLRAQNFCLIQVSMPNCFLFCVASMFPGTIILPIGLLLSGWSAQAHLPWIVTDIVSLPYLRLFLLVINLL